MKDATVELNIGWLKLWVSKLIKMEENGYQNETYFTYKTFTPVDPGMVNEADF